MNSRYPRVPLGSLLRRAERFEPRDPAGRYCFAGTYSFGRGIFVRGFRDGSDFSLAALQRIRKGDFVYCKIMAWEGAFALVPPEADDCVLSGAFVCYELDESKVEPGYLQAYFQLPLSWTRIGGQSTGTNVRRRSLHPGVFERSEIPLPPLQEQRRVLHKIEACSRGVSEARQLNDEVAAHSERMLIAMAHRNELSPQMRARHGWRQLKLSEVIRYAPDPKKVAALNTYPNCGIYSFARGLFSKPPIDGATTSAPVLYRIRSGQFIYSRLFAFEGAYAMVTPEFDGCFVSGEYPTFDCDREQILPEFLTAYFKSPAVWEELASGSRGVGHRRQRVLPDRVLAHRLWLPPLNVQKQIKSVMYSLKTAALQQDEMRKELDALQASVLDRAFKGEL